jgi:hypothetical protein
LAGFGKAICSLPGDCHGRSVPYSGIECRVRNDSFLQEEERRGAVEELQKTCHYKERSEERSNLLKTVNRLINEEYHKQNIYSLL